MGRKRECVSVSEESVSEEVQNPSTFAPNTMIERFHNARGCAGVVAREPSGKIHRYEGKQVLIQIRSLEGHHG